MENMRGSVKHRGLPLREIRWLMLSKILKPIQRHVITKGYIKKIGHLSTNAYGKGAIMNILYVMQKACKKLGNT